jgi:hypothetical protein
MKDANAIALAKVFKKFGINEGIYEIIPVMNYHINLIFFTVEQRVEYIQSSIA